MSEFPTYPCCEHCIPVGGECWAVRSGHGAYCLDCQSPATTHRPETTTDAREANPHG